MRKKEKPEIGIYKIEINGKCYVGSTTNSFKGRWQAHSNQLRKGTHPNCYLQKAFNEFGEDNLNLSIIELVEKLEEVRCVEQKYIDMLKPEYNICPVAGSCLGRKNAKPHNRTEQLSITIPAALKARLWEMAEKRKVTVSVLVEEVLRKAVE